MNNLEDVAMIMNPELDQVAIAKENIPSGYHLKYKGDSIVIETLIEKGHRFALVDIKKGEFVRQYGYPFGQSNGILKGESITSVNVDNVLPEIDLKNFSGPCKTTFEEKYSNRTFSGFIRKNGAVGTRNYYLVVPTSMCVSETALQVSLSLDNNENVLKEYSNIDGVVAIPHTEGCGCASNFQIDRFLRVLKGYVGHPNVGGCLIIDLGCEQTNYEKVHGYLKDIVDENLKPLDWITLQESGGTRALQEKAASIIRNRLNEVNRVKREAVPLEKLIVGTECGASDSFSGITANPVIGNTVDKIIYGGGSAVLSEIPEMVGSFNMLYSRFRTLEIANKFNDLEKWYTNLAGNLGETLSDNLVPKNIEGGLFNNYIKNLGSALKGGKTAVEDVIEYAEAVQTRGLNIMQGPGGDLESVTGIVAAGANVICFSTGYGATSGNAICPVIKISSNDSTFEKLPEDIDFNAGRLLSEQTTIDALAEELLENVILTASGKKTWSEKWKQHQFQVWTAGKLPL